VTRARPALALVVLTKAPIRGCVKTRLAAAIGPDAALRVHQRLVAHTLHEVERACAALAPIDVVVRVTPDAAAASARTWVPPAIRIATQGDGDLGARMERAMEAAFAAGAGRVVLIGTDCPGLLGAHIVEAFAALERADVVVGPARDGGYWLIGARAPTSALFRDVPWSTPEVVALTLARALEAGRSVALLGVLDDLDTAEDLARHPSLSSFAPRP
jgi:rSAM/selenodomain-associated transferase 1